MTPQTSTMVDSKYMDLSANAGVYKRPFSNAEYAAIADYLLIAQQTCHELSVQAQSERRHALAARMVEAASAAADLRERLIAR